MRRQGAGKEEEKEEVDNIDLELRLARKLRYVLLPRVVFYIPLSFQPIPAPLGTESLHSSLDHWGPTGYTEVTYLLN